MIALLSGRIQTTTTLVLQRYLSREDCMLKWKIAAVLGVAFGAAGVTWGYAQQSRAPAVYELRVSTPLPGERGALAGRVASRTAALFSPQRITQLGYPASPESDPETDITPRNTS